MGKSFPAPGERDRQEERAARLEFIRRILDRASDETIQKIVQILNEETNTRA